MLVHMVKILVPYLCRIGKQNNQFKPAIAIHNMGGGEVAKEIHLILPNIGFIQKYENT